MAERFSEMKVSSRRNLATKLTFVYNHLALIDGYFTFYETIGFTKESVMAKSAQVTYEKESCMT
jgi:hypothetical protein